MEYEDNEWVKNIQSWSVRLSRLDEENPFPERAEFSLSDAVWETAEPFTALAHSRSRSYSQNIEDGLTMTGDRAAVQQMVSILLDNANKYTPEDGSISLSARRAGRKNEITVSNTCEGAESIDVTRLFDRFYRADESHSTRIGGTGIGLPHAVAASSHVRTTSRQRLRLNAPDLTLPSPDKRRIPPGTCRGGASRTHDICRRSDNATAQSCSP